MKSTLPNLPRKNKRIEAKIDGKVAKWFETYHHRSVLLEVKMEGEPVANHQRRLLNQVAETGTFVYNFPDGGKRTPLDYVVLQNADAVLAVCTESGECECTINNDKKINISV